MGCITIGSICIGKCNNLSESQCICEALKVMKLYLGRSVLYFWGKETAIPILNRVLHVLGNIEQENVLTAIHMALVQALLQFVEKLPDRVTFMDILIDLPDSDDSSEPGSESSISTLESLSDEN